MVVGDGEKWVQGEADEATFRKKDLADEMDDEKAAGTTAAPRKATKRGKRPAQRKKAKGGQHRCMGAVGCVSDPRSPGHSPTAEAQEQPHEAALSWPWSNQEDGSDAFSRRST